MPSHRRFVALVSSGGAIRQKGWDHPIIIDLATLLVAQHVAVLYTHDPKRVLGATEAVTVDGGLFARGTLFDCADAREVIRAAKGGTEWHCSLSAEHQHGKVEFIPRGKSVEVNGRKHRGPVYVARQATLTEVSIARRGADSTSFVSFPGGGSPPRPKLAATSKRARDGRSSGSTPGNVRHAMKHKTKVKQAQGRSASPAPLAAKLEAMRRKAHQSRQGGGRRPS